SYLLRSLFDGSLRRFIPRPLLWLYVAPILAAGALGARHVGDIAPIFVIYDALDFHDAGGYLRDMVAKPLMMVLSALLVGAAVANSEKPERFLVPTVLSMWVICALVIVYFLLGGVALREMGASGSREILTTGLGMHANELGRLYAVAYALLLFTWAEMKEPGPKAVLLATMGVVVAALVLTFSRGAFFGFIVVNVLFLLWRRNVKTLIFCGVLAACAMLLLPAVVYERIATGFGSGLNAISAGRIEGIWLPLAPEVLRSPLYGNGVGSILWSEAMRREGGISMLATTHPHNAYLEALLDMGMAGLLLLGAYFAHVWRGFRGLSADPSLCPALRGFYLGAVAGLVSFLIAALADSSLKPKPEQAFLWLAIGMMYGEHARKRMA
ncbi:MAG: O-antigen ligase family protein, partial [Burkholderiales bacterium]